MWTQVETLYEFAKTKYKLTLHGGQSGLNNSASWVYLAEDIQNVSFLDGGEFVITTGLFTQSGIKLNEFIHTLASYNCSGILINVGQYLNAEDITEEIISFCDTNRFPLFTMPWEIHLTDIMRDYCSLFLRENYNENNLNSAFQIAINQDETPDSILQILNQYGFTTNGEYRIIVIHNLFDTTRITSPLNIYSLKYHLLMNNNQYVLIYNSSMKQITIDNIIDTICFCDGIVAGASDTFTTIKNLGLYYKRALFSLAAAELWRRQFICFENLGLFQILFCATDHNLLNGIYHKHLDCLINHDLEHNTDYTETLKVYLLSDCNLLETAANMHTHRNTIVYRINKIKELLNTPLDNSSIKFDFMMAFYVKEYLSIY